MPSAADFEKLGVFYLGRPYDWQQKKAQDGVILYDSKDLVTHAVCVGMTGSGKTGLCLALIEEAAIDGIPAILIDPKGDLANLLLTFPELKPEDFRPWVNEDDARRKSLSVDDYARQQAELWQKGLASWGEDGARIQRLRDAADFAVYTPGSNAGIPLSILKSFAAPPPAIREDEELLRERIGTTATSLLGLLGIDADPIKSREHILIATILDAAWRQGQEVDLPGLIQQIQTPPVKRVGVLELDAFFPSKDRFALAMSLNNLLAAPGFGAWMEGEPLDVGNLLHTPEGKPRVAIVSIAHLNDAERMFFVSLLLNQVVGWMRTQSGTTSLRALLYMDEIFGFFPPVANPPSKTPLLTLLKQARAFGVGVVLATQNPVDLDYKGLSNTGTWFIGRLQTERDKARLLDGLEGAAGGAGKGFDRSELERILSGLSSRVFLMNNVHEDRAVVFESRWAMSYLRGPLTRAQIKTLMDPRRAAAAPGASSAAAPARGGRAATATPASAPSGGSERPLLPPDVPQHFVPVRGTAPAGSTLLYRPMLFGSAQVRVADAKSKVDLSRDLAFLAPITGEAVPVSWEQAAPATITSSDLAPAAEGEAAVRRAARGGGPEEELRRLDQGLRGLATLVAAGRAAAQPVAQGGVPAGRVRARLPGAAAGVHARDARPGQGEAAPEVRAEDRGAGRAQAPGRAGGGARERAGQAAGPADRDLGGRDDPGGLPRPQVRLGRQHRPRHDRRPQRGPRPEGDAGCGSRPGVGGGGGRGARPPRRAVQGRRGGRRRGDRSADRGARDAGAQAHAAEHLGPAGHAGLGPALARPRRRPLPGLGVGQRGSVRLTRSLGSCRGLSRVSP